MIVSLLGRIIPPMSLYFGQAWKIEGTSFVLPPPTTTNATTTEMAMIAPLLKFAELFELPSAPVPAAPRLLLPNPLAEPPSPDCAAIRAGRSRTASSQLEIDCAISERCIRLLLNLDAISNL